MFWHSAPAQDLLAPPPRLMGTMHFQDGQGLARACFGNICNMLARRLDWHQKACQSLLGMLSCTTFIDNGHPVKLLQAAYVLAGFEVCKYKLSLCRAQSSDYHAAHSSDDVHAQLLSSLQQLWAGQDKQNSATATGAQLHPCVTIISICSRSNGNNASIPIKQFLHAHFKRSCIHSHAARHDIVSLGDLKICSS